MKRMSILLFMSTVMFMLSFICVSAQQIDVDHMNNEQLTTLLLQILDKLQLEETQAADTASEAKSSETPVPTAAPAPVIETEPETMTFSVYENKKLTVEALPAYMFIRPTQPPQPERDLGRNGDTSESGGTNTSSQDCYIYCANLDWGNNESYAQCVKEHCGTSDPPNVPSEWKQ